MEPKVKMEIKQATLLIFIFFSLVLVSSSSRTLYSEERTEDDSYSLAHIRATSHTSGHGGSSGGGTGGVRGSGSGTSQGDTGGDTQKPAGASNVNHHRRGGSIRVQSSVFLTWVAAILATQFSIQVL